jgi:hypothetical protein
MPVRPLAQPLGRRSQQSVMHSVVLIGSSSWSLPCSTSCIAAVAVRALVIDAIQNTESAVISVHLARSRLPNAPS